MYSSPERKRKRNKDRETAIWKAYGTGDKAQGGVRSDVYFGSGFGDGSGGVWGATGSVQLQLVVYATSIKSNQWLALASGVDDQGMLRTGLQSEMGRRSEMGRHYP